MRSFPIFACFACATFASPVVAGERYAFDVSHSHIAFEVSHLGLSTVLGEFERFEGQLTLDREAPENSAVVVTIDPLSIDSGHDARDRHLQGQKWLNTDAFEQIRFISTSVTPGEEGSATLTGDLTLLGVTRPVTLDVTLNGEGESPFTGQPVIGFDARGSLNRSQFGLTHALPAIGDEVTIRISAELTPLPEATAEPEPSATP